MITFCRGYAQNNLNDRIRIFDIWMEHKLSYDKWPGVIVGIVRDQELVWVKSYGYADLKTLEKIDSLTMFAIASNTKMFTAIGLMQLRNKGLLDLDDPVYKYVPEILEIKSFEEATPNLISIRHLLTHTSGLPVEPWYFDWSKRPMLNDIIENLHNLTLALPPSTRFKYSNLAYTIIGKIIENVTGMTYEDYITKHVLAPIGMTNSGFDLDIQKKYATGYRSFRRQSERESVQLLDYNGWSPAGGLYSNLEDLSKYVSWMLRVYSGQDSSLLDVQTLRDMHRVSWVPNSWGYGIGLGFFIYKNSEKMIGHGGQNPGFKTDITILPEAKIGIITLTNGEDIPELPDQSGSISARVLDHLVPFFKDQEVQKPNTKLINLKPYTGTYSGYWGEYKAVVINKELTIFRLSNKNPDTYILKLKHIKEHTFRVISNKIGRWKGEHVQFDKKIDGKMSELLMDGTTFERIKN